MINIIVAKNSRASPAIVYHAERLSPIEAVCYLSFFDDNVMSQTLMVKMTNSLKYDIAVIYCIFISGNDIRHRSR
jgi:hypothetical protein